VRGEHVDVCTTCSKQYDPVYQERTA
jgi:hypothetical protein